MLKRQTSNEVKYSVKTDGFADADNNAHTSWALKLGVVYVLLTLLFLAEVNSVHADGLFDFQMKLAQKGNAEAQFKVGEMYETGFGVDKNLKDAELWIKKAADQGHETSGFKLLYWDLNKNKLNADNKVSFDELVSKAEGENGQAMFYLGKMYANAVGVKRNRNKSLEWLNKAALQGIVEAEAEAITVRESRQKAQLKAKKAEEKRIALEKARKEKLKNKKEAQKREQERQRVLAESKRQQKIKDDAALKAKQKSESDRVARQQAAQAESELENQRVAEKARLQADQDASIKKEQKRQALLKKRAADKAAKDKFDSDPCSGKSARFLSTCR